MGLSPACFYKQDRQTGGGFQGKRERQFSRFVGIRNCRQLTQGFEVSMKKFKKALQMVSRV
jgi:hypothetical protein